MKRPLLVLLVVVLYLLHQDFWFWRTAEPLIFGFLPIGLFYHVCYTLLISALMWLLVKQAWPAHLESGEWGSERVGEWEDIHSPVHPLSRSSTLPLPHSRTPALPEEEGDR